MNEEAERANLLRLCRRAMPSAAGVVLATLSGRLISHEEGARDPAGLARDAASHRHPDAPTSALVPRREGLYLVVFVPG